MRFGYDVALHLCLLRRPHNNSLMEPTSTLTIFIIELTLGSVWKQLHSPTIPNSDVFRSNIRTEEFQKRHGCKRYHKETEQQNIHCRPAQRFA